MPSATCCSCAARCRARSTGSSRYASREAGVAMIEAPHYSAAGAKKKAVRLPDTLFDGMVNEPLLHRAVITYLANQRQGTHDTRTRSEVSGGNQKPWRQKGTGRARQGSTRAPHWRHGGVVFGPHPRSYTKSFPKGMKRGALRSALSAKVADGEVIGIDLFKLDGDKPSTRAAVTALSALPLMREIRTKHYNADETVEGTKQVSHKVLVIIAEHDPMLLKSIRNVPYITLRYGSNFSVRDILAAGRVVLAQ